MRILLVSEDIPFPNMGGLAKHVLNLARALVRAGHEVDLLGSDEHPIEVCGEEGRFGGRFIGGLRGAHTGWKEVSLGMYMPPRRTLAARRFARTILQHAKGYDVVHYHGHIPNVGRFLPANLNFVQTRHDQGSDCFRHTRYREDGICTTTDPAACAGCVTAQPNSLQRTVSSVAVRHFRREVQQSFSRHRTIFVSDLLRKNFERMAGPGAWGEVVHNFVDRALLDRVRKATPVPPIDNGFRVFIAAKLYPAKGIEAFLRALAPQLPPDLQLAIAGDGPQEAALRQEFAGDAIRFLGWTSVDDTLRHAASAHAIVVPSVWEEPCATTVLEGLFLGKPTFALRRGGTPELGVYAYPGQLRLHDNMAQLVNDLTTVERSLRFPAAPAGLGSADTAVNELLRIYTRKLPSAAKRAAFC